MGIFTNKGDSCEENEDGNFDCKRYINKNNEQFATGTDVTIAVDPQTCKARFVGKMKINDEDKKAMINLAKSMEDSCRKGF